MFYSFYNKNTNTKSKVIVSNNFYNYLRNKPHVVNNYSTSKLFIRVKTLKKNVSIRKNVTGSSRMQALQNYTSIRDAYRIKDGIKSRRADLMTFKTNLQTFLSTQTFTAYATSINGGLHYF